MHFPLDAAQIYDQHHTVLEYLVSFPRGRSRGVLYISCPHLNGASSFYTQDIPIHPLRELNLKAIHSETIKCCTLMQLSVDNKVWRRACSYGQQQHRRSVLRFFTKTLLCDLPNGRWYNVPSGTVQQDWYQSCVFKFNKQLSGALRHIPHIA